MKALIFAFVLALTFLGYSQGTLAEAAKPKVETATFAAGCFWGSEEFFRKIPGVVETRVGYAGGTVPNPKYEDTHDGHTGHAESVEIKFDPTKVSYEHLLDQFFKIHDPTTLNRQGNDTGNQYRSAIFYHDEEQKKEAMAFKAKVEKSGAWKHPIVTEVAQAKTFWPAEEYHQKYLQKHPGGYDNHYLRDINFDKFDKSKK
jgi:methionine-S-sulfoxide reductase